MENGLFVVCGKQILVLSSSKVDHSNSFSNGLSGAILSLQLEGSDHVSSSAPLVPLCPYK